MVVAFVFLQCILLSLSGTAHQRLIRRGEQGQATAEYALVMLGAAFVALLFVGWAKETGFIGDLLDKVIEKVTSKV